MTNTTEVDTANSLPESSFSQLAPGFLLKKRYRIQQELGEGNSSRVFLAIDTQLGALPVAIKAYLPSFICSPNFNKSYIRELQNSFKVNHENVIKLYDMIKSENFIALVTEYVDGITLEQMSANWNSKLEPAQVKELLIQTIRGLESIHSHNIVHRDLKPQNIMINTNGMVKIGDLGVARQNYEFQKDNQTDITKFAYSGFAGTPYYAHPLALNNNKCDFRHDLYSIGIVAYELITGKQLYNTETTVSFINSKFNTEIKRIRDLNPKCPQNLADVIEKLININCEETYNETRNVRLDLEKLDLRSNGLAFAPAVIRIEKKPSLFEKMQNVSKLQVQVIIRSIVQTILDIPRAVFLTPLNFLRHAFGSSVIIYPIVAIALYYLVKRKDIISRIISSFSN